MAPVDMRVGAGHMARRAGLANGGPGKPGTGCQELAGQGCEPAIDKNLVRALPAGKMLCMQGRSCERAPAD